MKTHKAYCINCQNLSRSKLPNMKGCEIFESMNSIEKADAINKGIDQCFLYEPKINKYRTESNGITRKWYAIQPTGDKIHDAIALIDKVLADLSEKGKRQVMNHYIEKDGKMNKKQQLLTSFALFIFFVILCCTILLNSNNMNNSAIENGLNDYVIRGQIAIWFLLNLSGAIISIISFIYSIILNATREEIFFSIDYIVISVLFIFNFISLFVILIECIEDLIF